MDQPVLLSDLLLVTAVLAFLTAVAILSSAKTLWIAAELRDHVAAIEQTVGDCQ